jgi:hypothetical protein
MKTTSVVIAVQVFAARAALGGQQPITCEKHKRDARSVVAEYSRGVRDHLCVEPVSEEEDAIFD